MRFYVSLSGVVIREKMPFLTLRIMSNSSQTQFCYNCNCSDSYSRDRRYHIQSLSTNFTSIKSFVLTYSRQDYYLYVSGTTEDDKNYPPLLWDTVKFEEVSLFHFDFSNNITGSRAKYFVHVAHGVIKFYRQKKLESGSCGCQKIVKDTDFSIFFDNDPYREIKTSN